MKANLYVFHGSQKTTCYHKMVSFGETLVAKSPFLAQVAFLAHDTNTIMDHILSLKEHGATEIYLKPLLLMPAVHFTMDLLPMVKESEKLGIVLKICPTLGESEAIQLSLVDSLKTISPNKKTCCVLLAHGSKKFPEVEKRLQKIMQKLPADFPIYDSYLMSTTKELTLNNRLESLKEEYDTIYVLPFFIFYGHLLEKIEKIVAKNNSHLLGNISLNYVEEALKETVC